MLQTLEWSGETWWAGTWWEGTWWEGTWWEGTWWEEQKLELCYKIVEKVSCIQTGITLASIDSRTMANHIYLNLFVQIMKHTDCLEAETMDDFKLKHRSYQAPHTEALVRLTHGPCQLIIRFRYPNLALKLKLNAFFSFKEIVSFWSMQELIEICICTILSLWLLRALIFFQICTISPYCPVIGRGVVEIVDSDSYEVLY